MLVVKSAVGVALGVSSAALRFLFCAGAGLVEGHAGEVNSGLKSDTWASRRTRSRSEGRKGDGEGDGVVEEEERYRE